MHSLRTGGAFPTQPLQVIARSPSFYGALKRNPRLLIPMPNGSIYVDRPPPDERLEVTVPINCLTTDEPRLRRHAVKTWTIEAVVLFLDNRL